MASESSASGCPGLRVASIFAATDGFPERERIDVIPQGVFCDLCRAILVAAPTIPAQQGKEGPEPVPCGFSHETLMDNPLLSASEHPAQHRVFTVPVKVCAGLSERPRLSLEYRPRKEVAGYASRRNQWIRCELQNGRVLVGAFTYGTSDEFNLQYRAFGQEKDQILGTHRSRVRSRPPVRNLSGLEIAGIAGLVVITAPITIPVVSLMGVSGQCPD